MARRAATVSAAVCVLLSGFAGGVERAAVASTGSSEKQLALELQRRLDDIRARYSIPGVALSVILPGRRQPVTVVAGSTLADPSAPGSKPVTAGDLYQIGSITKTATAALVLQLVADGGLGLGDRIGRFVPQYPDWKGATVRQLLNMTSGIFDYSSVDSFVPTVQADPNRRWTPSELVDLAYSNSPNTSFAPGKGWEYSNTNTILEGFIIEKITGRLYAAVLQRHVLGPKGANLPNTFYASDGYPPEVVPRLVHGYNRNGIYPENTDVTAFSISWSGPAGGLVSNSADVARWGQALFGTFLPRAQSRQLTELVSAKTGAPTDARDPDAYGLGVDHSYVAAVGPLWYKSGETFGYNSFLMWVPCLNVTFGVIKSDATPDDEGMLAAQNMVIDTLVRSAVVKQLLEDHPGSGSDRHCPAAVRPTRRAGQDGSTEHVGVG